jgi:hypothetical protein
MQTLSDVEYLDCVICLNKRQITIKCSQCNICNICGPCGNNLVESGQMARCPTCRLASPWISTTEFQIQLPFSPSASRMSTPHVHSPRIPSPIHIITENTLVLPPSNCPFLRQMYKYNICYCIICIIYVAYEFILYILRTVLAILNNENVKRFILISILSYIFGLITIIIATRKSPQQLPTDLRSWIPLLVGFSLLSGPIYNCVIGFNACHNEQIRQTIPTLFQQTREQHRHAYATTETIN